MATALRLANYWWIALGIVAYLIVEVAAVVRWQVLLRVQEIRLSNMRVGGLFLIGMFYNQFMPGGTGGDIVKTYLLWKETPGKKRGSSPGRAVRSPDRLDGFDLDYRRADRVAL